MYAEERQQAIARLVSERGRVAVTSLAERYDVTTETVRRDLSSLEQLGLVRRVHGGAVPAHTLTAMEPTLNERDLAHTADKDAIALAALDYLPSSGGMVLLDAGTSTARLAANLPPQRRLVIYTHSVPVANRLVSAPQVDLHLLPGRVRQTTQAAVGADTVAALDNLRADVVFIGANGVTVTHGLSTPDHDEAATKRALVRAARRVIVLADSSKIGSESALRFAPLEEVDVIITDAGIDEEDRRDLTQAGVEVVVA